MKIYSALLIAVFLNIPLFCQEENPPGKSAESVAPVLSTAFSVDDCIKMALLYNRDIQGKYLDYRKTDNDLQINRSDFLPKIDLEYDYSGVDLDSAGTVKTVDASSLIYTQRLLEFGRDAIDNVTTRSDIRNSYYSLKDTVRETVSDIRRDFFFIILKQQQMRERKRLLDEFRADLLIARAKFTKGLILEVDVFTRELNVLNEELRINEINRAILKRKMDLRFSMGCSIPLDFTLSGERQSLSLSEVEAFKEALEKSFHLSRLLEEISEKEREISEKKWEYMPQLAFQMGYDNYRSSVSVDLSQSDYVWGVDLTAEGYLDPSNTRAGTFPNEDMRDVSFNFQIKLPLFDGFKKREETKRERKELRILRIGYLNTREDLKRDVLKDYQDYYEQKERLEIIRRRVEIAKRRLEINEKLKEFGKVDDNQLETFRNAFFSQQDQLYAGQDSLIQAEEDIRDYLFDAETLIRILDNPAKTRSKLLHVFSTILKGDVSDED